MDLKTLEQIRIKKLFKFLWLLLLNTAISLSVLRYIALKVDGTIIFIVLVFFIIIYYIIFSIPKNFENEIKNQLLPHILKNIIKYNGEINWRCDKSSCLNEVFRSDIDNDDVFYGNYKGTEFVAAEGRENKIFYGTVIRIPMKRKFNNRLLIQTKSIYAIPINGLAILQNNLELIKIKAFKKHSVWAKNTEDISFIYNNDFIQYVNTSNKRFCYLFKNSFAYLIWPHTQDFYKFGSLFKKIEDKKQYQRFERDLQKLLTEIEKFANVLNVN